MALTAKKLGITSEKIKTMTLEQLEDALTDVIDAREGYPENSMSKNALELDELYLEIDTRINAINAGEETCNYKFVVNLCGGSAGGTITVEASNEGDAYEKAMDFVLNKLADAFPTLDIEVGVELAEAA